VVGYVVLVLASALCILALKRKGIARWVSIFLIISLALGITVLYLSPHAIARGENANSIWKQPAIVDSILFIAMVVGMAFRYLWDLIEVRRAALHPGSSHQPVHLNFDWLDFLQPLLVAGIVFAVVIGTAKDLSPTTILFSYQNGFFWQSILKARDASAHLVH
jgi:hypothetical protein